MRLYYIEGKLTKSKFYAYIITLYYNLNFVNQTG